MCFLKEISVLNNNRFQREEILTETKFGRFDDFCKIPPNLLKKMLTTKLNSC